MRVAAFMSGSGTNILKLIERQRFLTEKEGSTPFEVVFIFSDRSDGKSAGEKISWENGLLYCSYDIRRFHEIRSIKRSVRTTEGLAARKKYDRTAMTLVEAFDVDIIALGGYMSYTTLKGCVNVHPADLSICSSDGKRKYVGDHGVRDAIAAGESQLRASTLWTDEGVDSGPLLLVSDAIPVELNEEIDVLMETPARFQTIVDEHQERLKAVGDWRIFPKTIEMIARGRFALDDRKRVYVDGRPVPQGYRA